jgi:hypothetical protein
MIYREVPQIMLSSMHGTKLKCMKLVWEMGVEMSGYQVFIEGTYLGTGSCVKSGSP